MGGQLEDAIENQVSTLEEAVAPIPTVVFDDIVGFGLHPKVEPDQRNTSAPSKLNSIRIWSSIG